MAKAYGVLAQAKSATAGSGVTLYTVPANKYALFTIHVVNNSGAACYYQLYVDSDGTTADSTTLFKGRRTLQALGTHDQDWAEHTGLELQAGGSILFLQETASALTFTVMGVETD